MRYSLNLFGPLLALAISVAFNARAEEQTATKVASYPPQYIAAIRDAMTAFDVHNFAAATAHLDKADASYEITPMSLNIRGAIAIEQKEFDKGRELCEQALKLDPAFFPARFNLCEIPFVQKDYAAAREKFEKLRESFPKDDLLRFRIYLTYLLEKNETLAREHLDSTPFMSNTPVYYYTKAAWEFAHENPTEAKMWLDRGKYVFPPAKHQNFINVFYDLGWLPRPGAEGATKE